MRLRVLSHALIDPTHECDVTIESLGCLFAFLIRELRIELSQSGEMIVVDGERLVPYSPNNNLLKHGVVLLPSKPEEYGTEADLIRDIQFFLHRYVDVSPLYEQIASYYVLFTWVFDRFNELPYLRVRGDAGVTARINENHQRW